MDGYSQLSEGDRRGWDMSEPRDERPHEVEDRGTRTLPAGFGEYVAARERYFERLRIDSEIRRLERSWHLSARGDLDERATA